MKWTLMCTAFVAAGTLLSAGDGEKPFFVDRYGQYADMEYPGKVKSDEELKADVAAEAAYYARFTPPARTFWGSLPGSKEKYGLKATGFFHLEKVPKLNNRTVLVDPEGNLHFHVGICSMFIGNEVTYVIGREKLYEWLPTESDPLFKPARMGVGVSFYLANWIRKYGSYKGFKWQRAIVDRVRRFGFNGYGEFTYIYPGNDKLGFGFTKCLEHYSQRANFTMVSAPVIDPFAETSAPLLEKVLHSMMLPYVKHPGLIGYYSENEIDYPRVMRDFMQIKEATPAKKEFAKLMAKRYNNRIADFNRNWKTSFKDFDAIASWKITPAGEASKKDLTAFETHFFESLYKLVSGTIKKIDPNHLYLGARILPGQIRNDLVIAAIGKYCDAFGANYYCDAYLPSEVAHMAKVSGKPLILSEWNFGSPEQGLFGVRNVKDQKERAAMYRRYVENAAAGGNVIGVQWFCLLDESVTGRGWTAAPGERFNTGLFDVCDRPYRELLEAAALSNGMVYDLIENKAKPVGTPAYTVMHDGWRTVPVCRVRSGAKVDGKPEKYNAKNIEPLHQSIFRKGFTKEKWGEYRFGWDEQNFYTYVRVPDSTPAQNKNGGKAITANDSVEIFLGGDGAVTGRMLPDDRHLVIRANKDANPEFEWYCFGRKLDKGVTPVSCCIVAKSNDAYVMEVAIPWSEVGVTPKNGMRIRFDVIVNVGGRASGRLSERYVYNGTGDDPLRRDIWATGILE